MRILFIFILIIPFISLGQIMEDAIRNKEHPDKIDITKLEPEIISLSFWRKYNLISTGFKNKKGKTRGFAITKDAKIYDGNDLVMLKSKDDYIKYFEKYGYEYIGTDNRVSTNYATKMTYSRTYHQFRNNNNTNVSESSNKNINPNSLTKKNAVEELKQLKELLDLGIITQHEFDKKSKELKKIILGN